MMRKCTLAVVAVFALFALAAQAEQLYRYTDSRGVVHFVSSPEDIPAKYRKQAKPVTGDVSVLNRGGEEPESEYSVDRLAGLFPSWTGPKPVWKIVVVSVWRSRVFVGLAGLALVCAMLVLGIIWSRDIPRGQRLKMQGALLASFLVMLGLFWVAIFGPGVDRMLRGCEEEANLTLEATADNPKRQRLERLRELSAQAADRIEALLPSGPA